MGRKKKPPQRARVTQADVNEMMRLKRQGRKMQDIARIMGCHRQTVRLHLKGNEREMLRAEAQKQIMIEAIKQHFRELADFAGKGFKARFQPSPAEGASEGARVFFPGSLALPGLGPPLYMAAEWSRLHEVSDREFHLRKALEEHRSDSPIWDCLEEWEGELGDYRDIGRDFYRWLDRIAEREMEVIWRVGRDRFEAVVEPWLYGNILRRVEGQAFDRLQVARRKDQEDWVSHGTAIMPVKDCDIMYQRLYAILEEAEEDPLFQEIKRATGEIKNKQPELRELAREAICALEAIEMMVGYPGHCHLCPV